MHRILVAATVTLSLLLAPTAAMAEALPPQPATDAAPGTPPSAESAPAADPVVETDPSLEADPMAEAEMRQRSRRETQLAWHQGLALGALVAMVTTGVLGEVIKVQKATSPDLTALTTAHVVSATTTTLLYGSAATLALTAPPPTQPALDLGGFDPVALHRALTWLHAGTLGATVALGLATLLQVPGLTGAHEVLALTTTGLMAISGGLIVFNF